VVYYESRTLGRGGGSKIQRLKRNAGARYAIMISRAGTVGRNDYPIIIVITGIVILAASFFTGNEFVRFIISPLSIIMTGIGAVLTVKRNDSSLNKRKGFVKYQRVILFVVSMLLLSFFAYVLVVIFM
jgi:hypothetical protein